jgi:putative ABC transport system permease protein
VNAAKWDFGQVMLAVLLVASATLLIRSVVRLRSVNLGFNPAGVSTFTLVPSDEEPVERRKQFLRDLESRIAALPFVTAAGLTNRLPVRDGGYEGPVLAEGHPDLVGNKRPNLLYRTATPSFLRAMGMHLREGRSIDATDGPRTLPVTLVSESFARKMWPGESAIGKHLVTSYSGRPVSRTIVGVVAETRMTSVTGEPPFTMWVPLEQHADPQGAVLVIRSTTDLAGLTTAVRRIVAGLDPEVAVARIETMDQVVETALAQPLRLRFFLSLFGALALTLGGIGVYGVVSYAVTRRRAEFAVRVALGASPSRVLREVFRRGLMPVAAGTAVGVVAALALARLLAGLLFGVEPSDPVSIGAAAALLLLAGALAALFPALRAGRTDPAMALRSQ